MAWQDIALTTAGLIGAGIAVLHGVLLQRMMVKPFRAIPHTGMVKPIERLFAPLAHFSTFNWFIGGLALIVVAMGAAPQARLAVGLLVGSSYLFATLASLWGTRGKHPGWIAMAAALILIAVGVQAPGA